MEVRQRNFLLSRASVKGTLSRCYSVGHMGEVKLTHLQFADDALIICEKRWLSVHSMCAVLLLFEEISGLKVNFHKSMLTGVNITDLWLAEAALVMNCRTGSIPFSYFGLPIGGVLQEIEFLEIGC